MSGPSAVENWSSRKGFLLAAIGGAVGLGNVWRFPFIAGENGGGAFVIVYLVCIVLLGIPIMLAELTMGRRGHSSPVGTMRFLIGRQNQSSIWMSIGWLGILIPFLGLSYYGVVAGWSLDYVVSAFGGAFSGFDGTSSKAHFDRMVGSPTRVLVAFTAFVTITAIVVGRGVQQGIEAASKWLMQGLFVILVLLVLYAMIVADFSAGLRFLFTPDFSKITPTVIVMALGQAFFSLAVAVGLLMTFGAYLPQNISITRSVFIIASVDTAVALLAGMAIFPVVFANGLSPGEGPGLIFVTLPVAFGNMPLGTLIGALFFLLVVFAAFTTALGMLEPPVAYLSERLKANRIVLALGAGATAWLIGLGPALSFNVWSDIRPLAWIAHLDQKSIFESLDYLVANVMLPLNGLLIAVYAGWVLSKQSVLDELDWQDSWPFKLWRLALRFVAPPVIAIILVNSLI